MTEELKDGFENDPEADIPSGKTTGENTQKQEQQIKKTEIQFRIIKVASINNFAKQFQALLVPLFLKKISHQPPAGKLLSIVAILQEKAIALSVTEIRADKTAVLHSVMVSDKFRKKGIAAAMLKLNDKMLKKNSIKYIDTSWLDALKHAGAFKKLLKKSDWRPPQQTALNIKLDIENSMKVKWMVDTLKREEDNSKIIDWADISESDKQEILLMQKQEGFPVHLSPFQMPDTLDAKTSKALRINGKIAGWCILHNVDTVTQQCSTLYVKDEYRNNYRAMKLIANCGVDIQNKKIKYVIYQAHYREQNLIKYFNIITPEAAIDKKYHTLVSRKYYTETQDN